MREIKFDIIFDTCPETNGYDVEHWSLRDALMEGLVEFNKNLSLVAKSDNIHIRQYTGLKDKQGKEIYEGDIVKSHTPMPLTLCTHPKEYMEIVFDCGYFGVRDLGTSKGKITNICMVQPDDWLDLEVIGNIYELINTIAP